MDDQLNEMAEKVARLEATIEQMRAAGVSAGGTANAADVERPARASRRLLLRGAALAAGGAVVGALAHSDRVAASNNDPILIGNLFNTGTLQTGANCTGSVSIGSAFLFQAGSTDFATTTPWNAALAGVASNGSTHAGLYGRSDLSNGAIGVIGECSHAFKSYGLYGRGGTGAVGISIDGNGSGVWGRSETTSGVYGDSLSGPGVEGLSDSAAGVRGASASGPGVVAVSSSGVGVQATSSSGTGLVASGVTGATATGTTGLIATGSSGSGVAATGTIGASVSGARYALSTTGADKAALFLSASNYAATALKLPPPDRTDVHFAGEIDFDANNELWLCTSGGTPGTWRKIAGTSTAGAFHPVLPARVYDSRTPAPGPAAPLYMGETRLVNVAARRDVTTGAGVENNYIPAGASAIACNVTVVDTIDAGFLSINPGGTTEVRAATVNWFGSGQILNNGVTLTLNAQRELTIIAGGDTTAGTHIVIDVTGYYR